MKNLTDKQLNIAICEWRGWKYEKHEVNLGDIVDSIEWELGWVPPEGVTQNPKQILPSHVTGIEALGNMHEAEKRMTDGQRFEFYRHLLSECDADASNGHDVKNAIHATARQRAIALLRVVKPELFQ